MRVLFHVVLYAQIRADLLLRIKFAAEIETTVRAARTLAQHIGQKTITVDIMRAACESRRLLQNQYHHINNPEVSSRKRTPQNPFALVPVPPLLISASNAVHSAVHY